MHRVVLILLASLMGCASASYRVAHVELDPAKYEQLGYAEGRATWVLVLNLIPFGRPDQIQRAMEDAIRRWTAALTRRPARVTRVTVPFAYLRRASRMGRRVRSRGSTESSPEARTSGADSPEIWGWPAWRPLCHALACSDGTRADGTRGWP
jgi:hypothetical protein